MNKPRAGIATIALVAIIFLAGIAVGGVTYYIGLQSSAPIAGTTAQPESTLSPIATDAPVPEEEAIEKELEGAQLDSIDKDIQDIDKEAATI